MQSNFFLLQTWANDRNKPLVNIVAVLVDDSIYDSIAGWVSSYAGYVQRKLSNSKALVMPLNLKNISAYDIHRMLENVYFDGLSGANSHMIWLIMIWDIPLPVINQEWYVFPSVYPYVDFENQKYVRDDNMKYFVSNWNPDWQAEIWHWLINYGSDSSAYAKFFEKVMKYDANPDDFIWDSMWYEDFIADKKWFLNENFQYYRNKIMFWEDLWYLRYSPLMKKLFNEESTDNWSDILKDLWWEMWEKVSWMTDELFEQLDSIESQDFHTTKINEQQIKDWYLADYNDLFSQLTLTTKRENVFAWWRWIKQYDGDSNSSLEMDVDSSALMIQLKDSLYLWNDDLVWVIENLNDLLEKMVDDKIKKERYDMDIVVPVEYKKTTWKRAYRRCYPFVSRWENFYFWKSARDVDSVEDFSIYRWTFRNLTGLDNLSYTWLLLWKNPAKTEKEKTDLKLKSIGASYDIFSQQGEWNRWFMMLKLEEDLDTYDENKTNSDDEERTKCLKGICTVRRKYWPLKCSKEKYCETFSDFAQRWWWWASVINIDTSTISDWRYKLDSYKATDAWKPIYDIGWFQSLLTWKDEWMSWTGWVTWKQEWPQWEATNYKAYQKYASPTQVEWWNRAFWWYRVYENHKPNSHIGFAYSGNWLNKNLTKWWKFRDYWELDTSVIEGRAFNQESKKIFTIEDNGTSNNNFADMMNGVRTSMVTSIINPSAGAGLMVWAVSSLLRVFGCKSSEKYTYKFVSSVEKHDSTQEDEINWTDYYLFWENWKWWKYYSDINLAYSSVYNDTIGVALSWADSLKAIASWNVEYIKNLSWLNDIFKWVKEKYSQREGLKTDISDLNLDIDKLEAEISQLELQLANLTDSPEDQFDKQQITEQIQDKTMQVQNSTNQIQDKTKQIQTLGTQIAQSESLMTGYLVGIANVIVEDQINILFIYSLISSLFADNIVWAIERIVSIEWWEVEAWNTDSYGYEKESVSGVKFQFLPSWIENNKNWTTSILWKKNEILKVYTDAFNMISTQRNQWKKTYTEIKNLFDKVEWENEEVKKMVESINTSFENIFNFEFTYDDNEKDENADEDFGWENLWNRSWTTGFQLTWWTASALFGDFENTLKVADDMLSSLMDDYSFWKKIIDAAKMDKDFMLWLMKKWEVIKDIQEVDLIYKYVEWTKNEWASSQWAKLNHNLLEWVVEHTPWMNILTPDRPIDSPRYVTMQSVAEKEMKFIYPDLFKVEVYQLTGKNKSGLDIHELLPPVSLTWKDIKKNLIKYFEGKVKEYNAIIAENSAVPMNIYYNKIKSYNPFATPDKSAHPYGEFTYDDFIDAIWWEKMLDIIADILYYQSLTNKRKLSTWMVAWDIELIKDSFDLNEKREYVLKDYLTFKNEKNKLLLIPNYDMTWYEVAYVNSNWWDYIIPEDRNPEILPDQISDVLESEAVNKNRRQRAYFSDSDGEEDDCKIPQNWKLPIFKLEWWKVSSPWAEWFKCRLKKVKTEPIKLKFRFDSSLWELLYGDWWSWFVNEQFKEPFTDWGDSMSKYADAWDSLVNDVTWYDANSEVVKADVAAQRHNSEVTSSDDALWHWLSDLSKYIKISNSNGTLTENTPNSQFSISSNVDLWKVTVTFESIWDWCLMLNDKNLCKPFTISFNPKLNPFTWLVKTGDNKAWTDGIKMIISNWWGAYLQKVIRYKVKPWKLDHIDFHIQWLAWQKVIAWMAIPVQIVGYDAHDNRVDWSSVNYDFTVTQWQFLKDWAYQTWFTTNDFRDLRFYYQAPLDAKDGSISTISIVESEDNSKILYTHNLEVKQWAPETKLNGIIILEKNIKETNQTYKLTNSEGIYGSDGSLNVGRLQRLDIDMKDMAWNLINDLDSQIMVTSKNGLVVVWEVRKWDSWKNEFFETSMHHMVSGHVVVYYYPTTVAWNDVIEIDIPWLESRYINLYVKPAPLHTVKLEPEEDVLQLWDDMWLEVFLYDVWGNILDWNQSVGLTYDDEKIEIQGGKDWFVSVPTPNWYAKINMHGIWAGLTYVMAGWEYAKFTVDKHIFPDSGLNILYLNYFWNDWWNQWWYLSENNHHVESMMDKSQKLITTTTLLASEDKIKKMLWKIAPGFKILSQNNIETVLNIDWSTVDLIIWWLSSMKSKIPSLEWMQVADQTVENVLSKDKNASQNLAFFIPSDTRYTLKDGAIYDSGLLIGSITKWEIPMQLSKYSMSNGDNIWDVRFKGVKYWNVVLHMPNFNPKKSDFVLPWERYILENTFTDGSTYKLSSVWIFDDDSVFKINSSYKSIQNSDDYDEKIWFLWEFKNISLFAQWEIVWEATKKFGSELLINLWDPVLSRKKTRENDKVPWTSFDWWIGQEIYVDGQNDIFGTYPINFDGGDANDLLVIYVDGTIKLAKGYWWNPDLRNMQELMRVAVSIYDAFVWDVDGNGYDDIIVRTDNNQLRAYLNYGWIFDVDGRVACLNVNVFEWEKAKEPMNLTELYRLFVEDMNQDNIMDVITYDHKWYIKVFYWKKWQLTYLSKEKYTCDTWWYDRELPNTVIVDALWVQVTPSSVPIYDNSMLRWSGMVKDEIKIEEDELPLWWITYDWKEIQNKIKPKDRWTDSSLASAIKYMFSNTDVDVASQRGIDEYMKYQEVSLYENKLVTWGEWDNYIFEPISFLDPDNDPRDRARVWKNYTSHSQWSVLQSGDVVTVRVTIEAVKPIVWSYGDIIQWPWKLHYDEKNVFEWIRFITTNTKRNAVVLKRDWNFSYIIDNIELWWWETLIFEYDLEYKELQLRDMSITYDTFWSSDKYPDIKLQSIDGCTKDFDGYINLWWNFSRKRIPLQKRIEAQYETEEGASSNYTSLVQSIWANNITDVPWIVWDKINRKSILWGEISDDAWGRSKLKDLLWDSLSEVWVNVQLSLFEWQMWEIENVIDDLMKWMCNGFSFWWSNNCQWLPVPFNQAFLAPWKYHVFWCWDLPVWNLKNGIPIFFFPGTIHVWPVDLPVPNALKSPADSFMWIGWWTYPSFIRIYAAPTLTAQLGVAVCLMPQRAAINIPSPISDIGGNCVIFAVKPQCKNSANDNNKNNTTANGNANQSYPDFIEDVRDSTTCLQYQKWVQVTKKKQRSSAFNLFSFSSSYTIAEPPRDKIIIDDDKQIDDILGELQNILWDGVNVREKWDNALKLRVWMVSLSVFDWVFWKETMDKLYTKYFADARLTAIENWASSGYPSYSADFMWIIDLEISADIAPDLDTQETKNSIIIGDVDILWWDYTVNKIRSWIQQWIKKLLIDKWLDPQIRYILNQLTKMHVNIKLPNMTNLLVNEMDTLKNVSDNIGDVWANSLDSDAEDGWSEAIKTSVSKRSNLSHESMNEFNKAISNPFEAVASLMNQSNIINITVEPLTVKVPMIFSEDIDAYKVYLQQRLDVNQWILDQWWKVIQAFGVSCSKIKDPQEKQQCMKDAEEYLSSLVEFQNTDWEKMHRQIYNNLMILEKYRNFPFEIYEWIHVIDRYMSEIASLINNTIWYLSYWTTVNSERFVGYVDAIVLMVNIIKTYQLIIDFSVEWSKNCGNCAKDTYDQYSCKLALLCDGIQLPIIQIPNFKLPNITIDLTDIDLWLDIVLPEFNFQTVKFDLPDLPNLPEPPSIWANIKLFDLPNIPQLPEPPELPELPSFIPEVEMELPILPPAPELPRLPNEIEWLIKIAKLIGKIYCIVKWNFWLVWEGSVKAKIEQLTQRTYEVDWIDNIMDFTNWTAAPIKNYWVDYEISSHVDLQFSFDDIYAYLNALTKSINSLTTSAMNFVQEEWINKITDNKVMDKANGVIDSLDGYNVNLNVDLTSMNVSDLGSWDIDKLKDSLSYDLMWLESDEVEYVDYSSAKKRLNEVLTYFMGEVEGGSFNDKFKPSISKIEKQVNNSNGIKPNEQWIYDMRDSVFDYLEEQKSSYDDLANMINDNYDGFLAMIDNQKWKLESNSGKMLAFNVQLFNLDPTTEENLMKIKNENPYMNILDNKMDIVNWYWDAITTKTPSDLWLSKTQYLALRDKIWRLKNEVTNVYATTISSVPSAGEPSTQLVAKNWWSASNKVLYSCPGWLCPNAAVVDYDYQWKKTKTIATDPTDFSDGIYDKIVGWDDDGKMIKVVYSDSFATLIWDRYYKRIHKVWNNILMWTEKAIYKKCPWQKCSDWGWWNRKIYVYKIDKIPYEEKWITFDSDTILKIADWDTEVKQWRVMWQSYDVLSLSWKISDVDAYLIKLVDRIDNSYEKMDYTSDTADVRYILAIPYGIEKDSLIEDETKLELLRKTDTIKKLLSWQLAEIVMYDKHKETATIMFSNVDRKWYYARIATLKFDKPKNVYNINSPWSNQIVAWKQIVWDDQHPLWDASLYRPSMNQIVSEWDDLEWYVWTWYTLKVNRKDNVALSYINISQWGQILDEKYTTKQEDELSVPNLFQTGMVKELFTTVWIDHFGNKTEKQITVTYYIPDITVTDIKKKDEGSAIITAELSQDIDEWDVSFQRRRDQTWKTMRKIDKATEIPVWPWKSIIEWDAYSIWNDIAIYDTKDNVIALINPSTAEIVIQDGFKDKYEVKVDVEDSTRFRVCDKSSGKSISKLSIPVKRLVDIDVNNYTVIDLPLEWRMWMFNGWKAVLDNDKSYILLISPKGQLYSEKWMEWLYSFDRERNAVLLTLYSKVDVNKKSPIKVWLEVEPLIE